MINRTVLTGRITNDIELRKTGNGVSNVTFTLAVNRTFRKDGQPEADFINCVAWNKTADLMSEHLHKGSLIGVDGRIQTRNYEDKTGRKVYVTEVVCDNVTFLEPKNTAGSVQPRQKPTNVTYRDEVDTYQNPYPDIASDDLPF